MMENDVVVNMPIEIQYERIELSKKIAITIATFVVVLIPFLFFLFIIQSIPVFFTELMVGIIGNELIVKFCIITAVIVLLAAPFMCVYVVCMSAFGFDTIEKIKKYMFVNPVVLYNGIVDIDRLEVELLKKNIENKNK